LALAQAGTGSQGADRSRYAQRPVAGFSNRHRLGGRHGYDWLWFFIEGGFASAAKVISRAELHQFAVIAT
jgi:hypothetical protein